MPVYQLDSKVPDIHPSAYMAPTAAVIGNVCVEKEVSVWFNCVLRGDENSIHIGEHSNIQDLTMVHVDPENPVVTDVRSIC